MSKSKNVNAVVNDAATTPTQPTNIKAPGTLESLMTQYPNASLSKLSLATEVSYVWLLKKSRTPIAGVPYDPTATNFESVQDVFEKKGIDLKLLDWETLNETAIRNSKLLPTDMDNFSVGQKVYLHEDNTTPFEILYKTETHIVIMKVGTTEPRSWSHTTFLMKGPVFEQRTKGTDVSSESC